MTTQQKTIIAGSNGMTVEQLNREISSVLAAINHTIKVVCLSSNEVHLFYPVTEEGVQTTAGMPNLMLAFNGHDHYDIIYWT